MEFANLSWMDVESYLKHDDRVVVVTAACEQHAYLSLLTDVRVPLTVAQAACRRENVLIAPPLPYGISTYFRAYPGTISLSVETFMRVVREVIEELLRQGFRRVLVSNGHGGNTTVLDVLLIELHAAHPDARFNLFEAWRHPGVAKVAEAAGYAPNHANWSEAFPFTRVGDGMPDLDKPRVTLPRAISAPQVRNLLGDGNFGGPYTAPDDLMDRYFNAMVEAMVEALRSL